MNIDPSNQAGGIAKFVMILVSGILVSRFHVSATDATAIVGAVGVIGTFVWQIMHRNKVAAAQAALAAHPPTADTEIIASVAKAA